MSELPPGWAKQTLGEIGSIQLGKMLDKIKNKGTPTKYLRNVNVRWGAFDLTDLEEMRVTDVERTRFTIADGDLFICEGGEPGRCAVWVDGSNHLAFQKALLRFRPLDGISSEWIANALKLKAINGDLEQYFTGTTIKHLPAVSLGRVSVPVPPSSEQRRIVAKLDALSACSKRARAELDIIRLQVAKCRNALLSAAFCGELTREWRRTRILSTQGDCNQDKIDGRTRGSLYDLPAEWVWTSISQIASICGGLTKNPKRKALPRRVSYLRVANVYSNELRLDDVSVIGCTHAEFSKTRLLSGDLLIVEGNGSLEQIGRVALWNGKIENCLHQNHLIRARLNSSATPRFVLYWLLSPAGRSLIERVASSTSGLHTLSITKVEGLPVPICDLEEQHEIVRRIEAAFAKLDRLAAEARSAAVLLLRLDQAILAKAFRGELVPQDPEDESASVLLERIRAARAAEDKPTVYQQRLPRMSAHASR